MHESRITGERLLLQQLRQGSAAAFTDLYNRYSEQIYTNIVAVIKDEMIAEEIVQDIFTQIWLKSAELTFDQSFGAYLYRMARNRVYDFYRKIRRDRNLSERFKAIATAHYSHIEERLHTRENAAILQKALDSLPVQQKKVFQLCKQEGCSYKQAGQHLGISLNTVKEHLVKANNRIRHILHSANAAGMELLILILMRLSSIGCFHHIHQALLRIPRTHCFS